jgi:hypothetical protein
MTKRKKLNKREEDFSKKTMAYVYQIRVRNILLKEKISEIISFIENKGYYDCLFSLEEALLLVKEIKDLKEDMIFFHKSFNYDKE